MGTLTVAHLREILDRSDLSAGDKRRINRKLRRPRVRVTVLDALAAKVIDAELIDVESIEAAAPDWDAILEFLEKLLPLIIRLIDLFPSD